MAEFRMPSLGSDMEAGTLIEWRVKPGDRVRRRDVIAVVETEKADIEIEVYEDGIVEKLLVEPGQKVPVGTVLAVIRTAAEPAEPKDEVPDTSLPGEAPPSPARDKGMPEAAIEPEKEKAVPFILSTGADRIKASPYARRLADERSIDLAAIQGTGPQGEICAADVEKASATRPSVPEKSAFTPSGKTSPPDTQKETPAPVAEKPEEKDYPSAMRRAIASAMSRFKAGNTPLLSQDPVST